MVRISLLIFILAGCQTVTNTNSVVYEDGSPVKHGEVHIFGSGFDGKTFTDIHGQWSIAVPSGEEVRLCIREFERDIGEACYESGELYTPEVSGGLIVP